MRLAVVLVPLLAPCAASCVALGSDLPEEPPPLVSMHEPPALFQEPDDEAERVELPLGGYTGVHVTDGRARLGGLGGVGGLGGLGSEPEGVLVQKVVENSPGDAAGIEEGDLVLAVRRADGTRRDIHWPSEWRDEELRAQAGSVLGVTLDRAGVEGDVDVQVARRVRAADRTSAERFREEQRAGVVLRTATEVEARAAGLAPGGGAVIVGLARESPWRAAGLRFRDLVAAVDGRDVAHPQVLLDALREAQPGDRLALDVVRAGGPRERVEVPVTRREQELRRISVPLLFEYGQERGQSELSVLLGLVRRTSTAAAWEWRLLWLLKFGAGDADRLEESR